MVEAYVSVEETAEMYNDAWLKQYSTALIKRQWGQNLSKFDGMQLPGGVTINAQRILDEAKEEITALLESLRDAYELPADFIIG
jgi:hypothetical protein